MLSLLLYIVLGMSVDESAAATMIDTYTNTNIVTHEVVKDTLVADDVVPMVLRGGNVMVIMNTSVSNDGGDTMLARGIMAVNMNDHYTLKDDVRGTVMVKAQAHGDTLIEAQRDALVAVVAEYSAKTTKTDNMGTTHDGRTITQSTWSQRMWLTHYIMKDDVVEGVHVVTLVGYADVR